MTVKTIMLIGGPDAGKTNYTICLCKALESSHGNLVASNLPDDITYIEEGLAHLLQGSFAPRSANLDEGRRDFIIPIALSETPGAKLAEIIVPDVSGELWKKAVETYELPTEWMDQLKQSVGAFLFVRVLSDQNVAPLDWVTANRLRKLTNTNDEELDKIPTQISLCELLRFLEHSLNPGNDDALPKVAILVTAWDMLDKVRAASGPNAYIQTEYPLFAGRLKDTKKLDVQVFGVSSVGGDLSNDNAFRDKFLEGKLIDAGFIVTETEGNINQTKDLTLPLSWLISG